MGRKHRKRQDASIFVAIGPELRDHIAELLSDTARAAGVTVGALTYYAEVKEDITGRTTMITAAALHDPRLPHPRHGLWIVQGDTVISVTDDARAYSVATVPAHSERDILAGSAVAQAVLDTCRKGLTPQ